MWHERKNKCCDKTDVAVFDLWTPFELHWDGTHNEMNGSRDVNIIIRSPIRSFRIGIINIIIGKAASKSSLIERTVPENDTITVVRNTDGVDSRIIFLKYLTILLMTPPI